MEKFLTLLPLIITVNLFLDGPTGRRKTEVTSL